MENQRNSLINTDKMIFDEHTLVFIKNRFTIEEYIVKLCEITHFDNYNVSYAGRKIIK